MRVATAVYTLASVAVLVLMIMRPPVEVSSPSAAASAPAPEVTTVPAAAASAPAPEAPVAPAAATLPEQAMPAAAPVAVDAAAPVAPTTAVVPTAVAPVEPVAPVSAVAPVAPVVAPPPPALDQAVMMPPPTAPAAIAPPAPSGLIAPEEKKNDTVAPAAAKPAPAATAVPDYAQEQRLVSELSGAIREGEIVSLNDGAQPFMGILTATEQPRGGVILLHGCGNHPDWADVVHPLRVGLVSKGWTTLSLQMPILAQTAQPADYVPLFANADQRIDAGIALLKQKGISNVVLAAHSCGADMAVHWLGTKGDSAISAYVGTGMGEVLPLDTVKVPVLDVYGEKDFPAAISHAPERQSLMQKAGNPHSKQMVLPEADHNFKDKGDALNAVVATWLNSLPL